MIRHKRTQIVDVLTSFNCLSKVLYSLNKYLQVLLITQSTNTTVGRVVDKHDMIYFNDINMRFHKSLYFSAKFAKKDLYLLMTLKGKLLGQILTNR